MRPKNALACTLLVLLAATGIAHAGGAQGTRRAPGEGFVDVPGGPVWYRVVGTGSGVPLLILHGGPGGQSCRLSPLTALGDQRPVVLFDQLGSGRSGRPTNPDLWRLDRFVDELDAVRRRLGLKRVHLLGHSWGAALAVQYVLTKGGRGVESLILSGPLLSTRDWIDDANVLRRRLPQAVQDVLKRHEDAGTTDSPEYQQATEVFYREFLSRRRPAPVIPECEGSTPNTLIYETMWGPTEFHATGNLKSFDVTGRLGELRMPVLRIVGRYDEARPETAARYQKLIPGSQLRVIEDAAHATIVDQPERYLQVVREFLSSAGR
jgi:proline iminopeptidase